MATCARIDPIAPSLTARLRRREHRSGQTPARSGTSRRPSAMFVRGTRAKAMRIALPATASSLTSMPFSPGGIPDRPKGDSMAMLSIDTGRHRSELRVVQVITEPPANVVTTHHRWPPSPAQARQAPGEGPGRLADASVAPSNENSSSTCSPESSTTTQNGDRKIRNMRSRTRAARRSSTAQTF